MEMNAQLIGINGTDMTPEVLAQFILLHELGHIMDYNEHFPDFPSNQQARKKEKAGLPIPGADPTLAMDALTEGGQWDTWYEQNKTQLATNGFPTRESIIRAQEQAYHNMPTERRPDEFAARILHKMGIAERV
jgi:hypothetical protein